MFNYEDARPMKGEGRLTDEVLREKLRHSSGPIWGGSHQPPKPIGQRPAIRPR